MEAQNKMLKHLLAPKELIPYLKEMYLELLTQRFSAVQVPDPLKRMEGRNIWVREASNPSWYSELVEKYPKTRKSGWSWQKAGRRLIQKDSIIKRGNLEKLLLRLVSGKSSCSKYVKDLFTEAKRRYRSGLIPITEAEVIFFEVFNIVLCDSKVIKSIGNIPMDCWEEIAFYRHEYGVFPEWLFFNKVPF